MIRSFWRLSFVAVLATGLACAQQTDVRTQNRTRPVPPGQNAPAQQTAGGASTIPGQTSTDNTADKISNDPTDVRIRIQRAFQQDPDLANRDLGAYVSTDMVSLAGAVKSDAAKQRAGDIAQSMAGGRAVSNQIRVSSSPNYIGRSNASSDGDFAAPAGTFSSPSDTSTSTSGTGTSGTSGASGSSTSRPRTPPHR